MEINTSRLISALIKARPSEISRALTNEYVYSKVSRVFQELLYEVKDYTPKEFFVQISQIPQSSLFSMISLAIRCRPKKKIIYEKLLQCFQRYAASNYSYVDLISAQECENEFSVIQDCIDKDDVQKLITESKRVVVSQIQNLSLIDYSAHVGSLQCFKYFLKQFPVNQKTLEEACYGGSVDIIHLIREKSIQFSPECLQNAIIMNHNHIADLLMDKPGLYTSASYLAAIRSNNLHFVIAAKERQFQLIVNQFFNDNSKQTPDEIIDERNKWASTQNSINEKCQSIDVNMAKYLFNMNCRNIPIDQICRVIAKVDDYHEVDWVPRDKIIKYVYEYDSINIFKIFFKKTQLNMDMIGKRPLKIIEYVLTKTSTARLCLYSSYYSNFIDSNDKALIKLFIKHQVPSTKQAIQKATEDLLPELKDLCPLSNYGKYSIDDFESMKYILDNGGKTNGLLHRVTNLEIAKLIIDHGADINEISEKQTPLIAAVKNKRIDMVTLLLENGADPNCIPEGEKSPLALSLQNTISSIEKVQIFCRTRFGIVACSYPFLNLRRVEDRYKITKILLKHDAVPD